MRFSKAIKAQNKNGRAAVIPDIKCISPKEGDLLKGRDPVSVAKQLVGVGAPVLSVVTEEKNFGGSPELLRRIVQECNVPVLRKDFIKSESEIVKSLDYGAAAVLLISAIMPPEQLAVLFDKAVSIGIEPFVEVCSTEEMQAALRLGAGLIGINNRNITTLELDDGGPARTAQLAGMVLKDTVLVSESGILCPEDARLAARSGAHAVLVGTALWQSDDICEMYQSLRVPMSRNTVVSESKGNICTEGASVTK